MKFGVRLARKMRVNEMSSEECVGFLVYDTTGLNGPQRKCVTDLEPTLLGKELCPGIRPIWRSDSYSAANAGELLDAEQIGGVWVGHAEGGNLELQEVASGKGTAAKVLATGCFMQPGNRALHAVNGSKVNRSVGGKQVLVWTSDDATELLGMLNRKAPKAKLTELRKGDLVWLYSLEGDALKVQEYTCKSDGADFVAT